METIDFNEVIKDNIEVVGGLLPEANYQSKGLCSTNIAKQKVDTWRGSSLVGYIQIAKVLKSGVYGLQNQLLIEVINTYNYLSDFLVTICDSQKGIIANCISIKDDSRVQFYYNDDGNYLYIYINSFDMCIHRKVLSAPSLNEEIGNMVTVDSIDTGKIIAKN